VRDHGAGELSALLFEEAQILDSVIPDDPGAFISRLNRIAARGLENTKAAED
jgi:molecular chaperone HtpG